MNPTAAAPSAFGADPALLERCYLDAATYPPVHPAGREALLAALDDGWADPRRLHREGRTASLLLEGAREAIAEAVGARTEEVVFTDSHVSAVHAAVLGTAQARRRSGDRVLLSAVEHSAVLHAAEHAGEAVRIGVDRLGRVDVARFTEQLARPGVALACLQSANGEVGTVQPVGEVSEAARANGVPLLVDAAASLGHQAEPHRVERHQADRRQADPHQAEPRQVEPHQAEPHQAEPRQIGSGRPGASPWDLLVADPRAWGAPPGVGVLAIRAGTRWTAPGPADDGTERVAGAPSVPAALAAAVTLRAVLADRDRQDARRRALVARIRSAAAAIADTEVVGDPEHRLPHVVTFSCLYVDGETIVGELDRAGFAVGSGSACTASTLEPSHVLAAMGVLTHGNIRVGLPFDVTAADVDAFCAVLPGAVARVRAQLGAVDL